MKREDIYDIEVWRALRVAAKNGSMADASAKLGVRPEQIHSWIKTLEKHTRKQALKRTTRRCQITEDGKSLLETYCQLLQQELEETQQFLQKSKPAPSAPIQKPGTRFEVSIRCAEDGQWVALSNTPSVTLIAPRLEEVIQKMTQALLQDIGE
jgi:transposase-like protein